MEFRKTLKTDIENVMKIIKQAQRYFKDNGIDQWQNNYPNPEVIENDINNEESYVLTKDNKIIGTTVISFNIENTYTKIYEGKWIKDSKYGVIHRIAIDNNFKGEGFSHEILKYAEKICLSNNVHSIKVDTHEDNKTMQNLLKKNGYKYCGIIYLSDGAKRIAFQKIF